MATMSTTDISRSQNKPNPDVLRTLWDQRPSMSPLVALGAASLILVLAYLPNLLALITVWWDNPDYNHGYLVVPIALFILWQQLSSPAPTSAPGAVPAPWWGWIFLAGVLVLRALMYERSSEWSENSTLILAVAGLTWSFGSWSLLRRTWPAIAFLVFMLPLPQSLSQLLALPLQSLAASSSTFLLQLTGMWVIREGNVINLSTAHGIDKLDVALACNGLRMLMTMAATVVATVILIPLPNWKRIVLLLSIVPIALISNMARIVATGWAYYLFEGPAAKHFAHDWAGLLMMPLGLALVALELGVMSWLVPKESEDDKLVSPLLYVPKKDAGKNSQAKTGKNPRKPKKTNQDLNEI
jgi:exosortase